MAKLDSLELVGFKSFPEKTSLRFNSAITAVVGPNGCGKSNIADAINWVVGEQSVKSLRADKMEDVIFNGTARRKSMGLAEVTLRFREFERARVSQAGEVEVRYTEEAAITRRMYRTGESEYFIDDKHCRLKDIYELLEGTGLGHTSYALIEQGRIERILSAKPQERRQLIEEAAKVAVFKSRKKAALIKLEAARQNLSRITDLLFELERQLRSLQRQAAGARRYARLREEYRAMLQHRTRLEFQVVEERLRELRECYAGLEEEDRHIRQELAALGEERETLAEELESREERMRDMRDRLSRAEQQKQRTEQQIHYQVKQAQESAQRAVQLRSQAEAARAKAVGHAEQRERVEQGLSGQRSHLAALRQDENRLREDSDQLQRQTDQLQQQIQQIRKAAAAHSEHIQQLRGQLTQVQKQRALAEGKLERLHQEGMRLSEQKAVNQGNLAVQRKKKEDVVASWENLKGRGRSLEEEISSTQKKLAVCEQENKELSDRYSQLRHRLSSLEEMEQRRAHYSEGTQKFLSSNASGNVRYEGLLADMVDSKAEYEYVVEQYLNEQLQYVVVDSIDDGMLAVSHARQIKAGKCTFLSLHGANGQEGRSQAGNGNGHLGERGAVGWLRDQLEMKPELEVALRRIQPDFFSTLLVRDLDAAKGISSDHPEYSFLTLDGDYLSPRGLLSSVGDKDGTMGVLRFRRQKREVEKQCAAARRQLEEANSLLSGLRTGSQQLRDQLRETLNETHRTELEKTRLEHMVETLEKERVRLEQAESIARREKDSLLAEQAGQGERIASLETEIARLEGSSQSSAESLSDLQAQLAALQEKKEEVAHRMADVRAEIARLAERIGSSERELVRLQQDAEDLGRQVEKFIAEAARLDSGSTGLLESNESLAALLSQFAEEQAGFEEELHTLSTQQQQAKSRWADLDKKTQERQARHEQLRDSLAQTGSDRTRCETEQESLDRFCQEEFQTSLAELLLAEPAEADDSDALPVSLEEAQAQCLDLRQKIDKFGAVNMRALEEFQEIEERKNFQEAQKKDIEDSIETTRKTIDEIDRHSSQQFKDAFEQINRNFAEVYQILFSGGHAEMRLLDEEDPSESGIEIIASPPGKRLQSMMLLSGGEKALTALALLMAIFRFRPAPFCLLDEVDAPLDEANVQRFISMLTQMSASTQFVLITHNKRTIEAAQYLYGVTMQEPGVSRIVSVRFS